MITLFELAFSSYLYSELTDYENRYLDFRTLVGDSPNLAKPNHRDYLLDWLNKWGCRFELDKLPQASSTIEQWFRQYKEKLCPKERHVWQLNDWELDDLGTAYEDLQKRFVFSYSRAGKSIDRRVGPTAASKVLFALRPRAALAWDDKMRKGLKDDHDVFTYRQFLERAKNDGIALKKQCKGHGIRFGSLPAILNRGKTTMAQLISEYYWVKHTRGIVLPKQDVLRKWVSWNISV